MSLQVKVALAIVGVFVIGVGGLLFAVGQGDDTASDTAESATGAPSELVREDSHVVGEEGSSDVVLVEFLDFECEACGGIYPFIEQLREEYAGEVTFVVRYFPLPGHPNSERAARAAEAAARQDKFDEMYQRLFETQESWSHQQEPQDDTFRGYAEDLGLDMDTYDADYESEDVAERVQRDLEDGTTLGVQGTPTFFLDGEQFEPTSAEDFVAAIDDALAQ